MRLWTVHPKYLDAKGLVALWRESAPRPGRPARADQGIQTPSGNCSASRTHRDPLPAVAAYLVAVQQEARTARL